MENPLYQFEIKPLVAMSLGGIDLALTNQAVWMLGTAIVTATLLYLGSRRTSIIPGRSQSVMEITYALVEGIMKDTTGRAGLQFLPVIFAIFMFIAALNLAAMIPGSYATTSQVITTGAMAVGVITMVVVVGFIKHGFKFLRLFMPSNVPLALAPIIIPLEMVSFLIRPFTLAVRLGANMLAGTIAVKIFAGFVTALVAFEGVFAIAGVFPLAGLVALSLLKIMVSVIQAYIFTMMSCVYLNDALHLH